MERAIDRFDAYMASVGLNDNKVTVQLGLTIGLVGKSRKPGRDLSRTTIEKILNYYTDLNGAWLLTGEGPMLVNQPQPEAEPSMQEQIALENSLITYLQKKIAELESKVDKLNDEKAELLQENAVLKYENMIMSPRKGDAENAGDSLSASAI